LILITVYVKVGGEIRGACRIFRETRVRAHVSRVDRLDGEGAALFANFANGDLIIGLDFGAIKVPRYGNGRVALDNGALRGYKVSCVYCIFAKGE
jgi:hypothetical protein